jgi:PAT family beta-lactamase induction signal transducer AmpG
MYFTKLGIPISTTTMVSGIAASPYIIKFIIGGLTDYFIKYGRKIFIVLGGLVGSLCIFPLAFIDPKSNLLLFTSLFFISHAGVVFLDVAADAWAIQISKPNERGKVNSAMFGGLFGGTAIGSVLLAYIADTISFQMTFIVSGFIIILTIIFPLMVKEIKLFKKRPKIAKTLVLEFKKKNTMIVAFFGFVVSINFGIILLIIPDYMLNVINLDVTQTGTITMIATLGIIIGAVIGGALSDKYGRKKTLYMSLSGVLISSVFLVTANNWQNLLIVYTLFGFFQGASIYSAMMALLMDITNPKIGATQLSILTSLSNFGEIGIGIFSGIMVLALGYHRLFLYSAIFIGASFLILNFVEETKK